MNYFRHIRLLLAVLFLLSAATLGVCADFSIAVVGVSGEYRRFFEEKIHETLEKIPDIQVVEVKRESLEKYYKGRKIPYPFPTKILSAVGKEMGVDYVISGHQSKFDDKRFLNLRLIQVKDQNNVAWIVNRIPKYPFKYYSKIDVMTYDLVSRLANNYPSLRVYAIRDSIVDPRDGQTYKTLRVRDQVIFAENLNFDAGQGSYCYDDDPKNCKKYGRLYTWEVAMAGDSSSNEIPSGVQGLCPEGWHFPSLLELAKLEDNIFQPPQINKKNEEYSSYLSPYARTNNKPNWDANLVYGVPEEPDVPQVAAGMRTSTGNYKYFGSSNHWWTASAGGVETAKEESFQDKNLKEKIKDIEVVSDSLAKKKLRFGALVTGDNQKSFFFKRLYDNKKAAYPVRCIINQTNNRKSEH